MEKILFYIPTNQFGVNDFLGYKSLRDFYNTTITSIKHSSNLHPLRPLKTMLVTDENGVDLLVKNTSLSFGEVKEVNSQYNLINLFENDFPALLVEPTVIPFYDIPLNLYKAKLLCFNVHKQRSSDIEAARYALTEIKRRNMIVRTIMQELKDGSLYSMNTCILGSASIDFFRNFAEEVKELLKVVPKINNESLFFEFIKNVYLYYYAQYSGITISTVNPYIPEDDYPNFKYFLSERLCIYIVGDKQNELTMNAIEKISNKNLISK